MTSSIHNALKRKRENCKITIKHQQTETNLVEKEEMVAFGKPFGYSRGLSGMPLVTAYVGQKKRTNLQTCHMCLLALFAAIKCKKL